MYVDTPAIAYMVAAIGAIMVRVIQRLRKDAEINSTLWHYFKKMLTVLLFVVLIQLGTNFNNILGWIISVIFIIATIIAIVW